MEHLFGEYDIRELITPLSSQVNAIYPQVYSLTRHNYSWFEYVKPNRRLPCYHFNTLKL